MRRRASRLLRLGLALLLLAGAAAVLWRLFAADPGADAVPVTLEAARTTTLRSRVVGVARSARGAASRWSARPAAA